MSNEIIEIKDEKDNYKLINNSGGKEDITVPAEIADKFNWGAFLLSWIWGLGNNTYITLLAFAPILICFIPFVNILCPAISLGLQIWFGIKGNEWAWRNKKFDSINSFHEYQKLWVKIGIALLIINIVFYMILIIGVITLIAGMFNNGR